nr:hypothetical protein REQ54_03275 [Rhizobium sp. Q54]
MSEHTPTARSRADIATEHASKYLQQLCKHFAHKRPVTFDERNGEISLMTGTCQLRAEDGHLLIAVESNDTAHLPQLEDVVARHLVRFAFREEMKIDWQRA